MRKFTILLFVSLFALVTAPQVFAQDLMINGNLELWDDPNTPTDWDNAESITQEDALIHGDDYSAKHTSASGTQDFQQVVEGVVAGENYTITYYYLDNDPMARSRIWSYWLQGTSTLPDNEDILRPGTYSEDNADWQMFTTTLTAPAGADGFRFEVRVYKQDDQTGGAVYYDDFSFMGAGIQPEPTNYPTDFTATANGIAIDLGWTDATGDQLPGAYLIKISDLDNIVAPVDGTYESDDLDLTDGEGALNVPYGQMAATIGNLAAQTTYHFEIYPYTNGGSSIDYKNDGTAPSASALTANITALTFEDFSDGFGEWSTVSVIGDEVWIIDEIHGLDGSPCAKMSGFVYPDAFENEDWMISPAMNFDMYENEIFSFHTATNYDGEIIQIKISNDYDGSDPTTATWTDLSAILATPGWDWVFSGDIDVSGIDGENVYLAFKYLSNSSDASTWEIDDVLVTGVGSVGIDEPMAKLNAILYPNPATNWVKLVSEATVSLKVFDITGKQILQISELDAGERVELGMLNKGLYFATMTNLENSSSITQKIIVE